MSKCISPYKNLQVAKTEKDVESAYRISFDNVLGSGIIDTEFQTDGLLNHPKVNALMEFKYSLDFKKPSDVARALIQAIYYLHKLEEKGKTIPKAIFVGDINECFCIPTKVVAKYLKQKTDWNISPSSAYTRNLEMYEAIKNDNEIHPFIYDVVETFDLRTVLVKMAAIFQDKPYAVTITNKNIVEIFNKFQKDVVKEKTAEEKDVDLVDVFFSCLIDPVNTYIHPNRKGVLIAGNKEVRVNEKAYLGFFSQFRQIYTTQEKKNLTANKDRILEDIHRRRTGAFFTPPLFVAKAHEMIAEAFGENWKDEYVVWDCAAGTANLTRDYNFKELYISTIEEHDLKIIKEMGYNKGASIFHYDFLNDDEPDVLGDKIPEGLRKAFEEGKKVLFFINPPFGASGNKQSGTSKKGIGLTKLHSYMKKDNVGPCIQQIQVQFMYKIIKLKQKYSNQIQLCLFAPPLYISGGSFSKFREHFYKAFEFTKGILFQASHFADVKTQWGISFAVWKEGENKKLDLVLDLVDEVNFELQKIGTKLMYPANTKEASKWVREEIKGMKAKDAPQLSSTFRLKDKGKGKLIDGALGYMLSSSNSVYDNAVLCALLTSTYPGATGFSVIKANFGKAIALFCARKTISNTWINHNDDYLIPNTSHPDYEQWNNDAIVFGLFNPSSRQSSLRNITYKDKKWDIHNASFFMSNEEMKKLANEVSFDEMYQDAVTNNKEAYVYELLQKTKLSDDAKEVLEAARNLVRKTMRTRKSYNDERPECNLIAWDAGWGQLKPYLKEYHKEEYNEFVKLYRKFNERMRKGVYKFGFLK